MASLIYRSSIVLLFIVSAAHAAYTFIDFKHLTEPALWFFSGGLVMLFSALLNIIHHRLQSQFTRCIVLPANISLVVFCTVLTFVVPVATTIFALLVVISIFVTSIYAPYGHKE